MPDNENLLNTQDLEDSVSIDNLTQSPDLDGDDVVVLVHENNGVKSTYKAILRSIANFINKLLHYSTDLHTQNDTIIGAINELADGGGGSVDITTEITTPSAVQTFNDGGDNIPLKSCNVAIVAQQAGTGTPSPSNPRSVTVFSSVALSVSDGTNTTVYNIPLGQTIAGGTAELVGGNGVKDYGYILLNGTESWSEYPQQNGFSVTLTDSVADSIDMLCNLFPIVSTVANFGLRLTQSQLRFCHITDNISGVTDLATWKTWLSNNNVQVVYPLLNDTAFAFGESDIPTLSGLNNVYADSGDIQSLEYFNAGANDIDSLIDLETREFKKGKKVKFDITASHPNNPTAYSIVVKVAGNSVFSKAYACNTYGVFAETTDYFVYDGEIYTVVAQGFQANTNQKMLTFAINDESYEVKCSASNSSYATEDSFSLKVGDGIDASDVYYDNSTSGLTATNLQDAIDEIVSMMQ